MTNKYIEKIAGMSNFEQAAREAFSSQSAKKAWEHANKGNFGQAAKAADGIFKAKPKMGKGKIGAIAAGAVAATGVAGYAAKKMTEKKAEDYLSKIASMASMAGKVTGKAKAFGEAFKGTAAKQTKKSLDGMPTNRNTLGQRVALGKQLKSDKKTMYKARGAVAGVGAAAVTGGVMAAKKKD